MFSMLRTRFGIPGVISVMALVFAMFGGAYAASNSSDGGKATASAKAKKGPRGPKGPKGDTGAAGPAGPQGPAGPAGATGAKGDSGAAGASGAPGQSVTGTPIAAGGACGTGVTGVKYTLGGTSTNVCNGKNGTAAEADLPETLPSGSSETGTWALTAPREEEGKELHIYVPISFPVRLEESLDETHVHYRSVAAPPNTECPGTALEPEAQSGHLCIYTGLGTLFLPSGEEIITPDFSALGAGPTGAILQIEASQNSPQSGFGTWAVTAP